MVASNQLRLALAAELVLQGGVAHHLRQVRVWGWEGRSGLHSDLEPLLCKLRAATGTGSADGADLRLLLALLLAAGCRQLGLPAPRLGAGQCRRHAVQGWPACRLVRGQRRRWRGRAGRWQQRSGGTGRRRPAHWSYRTHLAQGRSLRGQPQHPALRKLLALPAPAVRKLAEQQACLRRE